MQQHRASQESPEFIRGRVSLGRQFACRVSGDEHELCKAEGLARSLPKTEALIRSRGTKQTPEASRRRHVEGRLGELVAEKFSQFLGECERVYHEPGVRHGDGKNWDIRLKGWDCQVKFTARPMNSLITYAGEALNAEISILVTPVSSLPESGPFTAIVRGWIWKEDWQTFKELVTEKHGDQVWGVRQRNLRPLDQLPAKQDVPRVGVREEATPF